MGCFGAARMIRTLCAVAAAAVLLCEARLVLEENAQLEPFVTGVRKTRFGSYVWVDTSTMVVSASGDNGFRGALFVFKLVDGVWEPEQKLTLPNGKSGDVLGWHASVRGDRIVAGAIQRRVSGIRTGQAFIFERQPDVATDPWALVRTLDCSEIQEGNTCGYAVQLDDNYVYINSEQGLTDAGVTYGAGAIDIFEGSGGDWTLKQTLRGENWHDQFGDEIKLGGIWMASGSPYADTDADNTDTGAVYMFRLNKFGKRKFGAKLVPPVAGGIKFGTTVGMSENGKTVAVGADRATGTEPGSAEKTGAVFVYKLRSGVWSLVETVAPQSVLETLDSFGYKINFVDNILIVSAWGDDDQAGAFHLFRRKQGKWDHKETYVLSPRVAGDEFGGSMDVGGGWLAVGASDYSSDPEQPDLRDGIVQMYKIVDLP